MTEQQFQLPMLTHYSGPKLLPQDLILSIPSYREAVRLCWRHRTRRNLFQRTIAEEISGLRASHLTEYLSEDPTRREMPARFITEFENSMGNRAITQWLTRCAGLHHLEQVLEQQQRAA